MESDSNLISYRSYCSDHGPKQKNRDVHIQQVCHICYEAIEPTLLNLCLYSPCCKNSWFHKLCLQQYASSAGRHFFKCPLCYNSTAFVKEMELHGIYIPDNDASRELEENAFEDFIRPECGATICFCSEGRQYSSAENSEFTSINCACCVSNASHKYCGIFGLPDKTWICQKYCGTFRLPDKTWICRECSFDKEIEKSKSSSSILITSKIQCATSSTSKENETNKSPAISTSSFNNMDGKDLIVIDMFPIESIFEDDSIIDIFETFEKSPIKIPKSDVIENMKRKAEHVCIPYKKCCVKKLLSVESDKVPL